MWKISEGKLHPHTKDFFLLFFFPINISEGNVSILSENEKEKNCLPLSPEHFLKMGFHTSPKRRENWVLSQASVFWKVLYSQWSQVFGVQFLQEAAAGGVASADAETA